MRLNLALHKNRSSPIELTFYEDGALMSFDGVTSMVVELYSKDNPCEILEAFDTATNAAFADWSEGSGEVNFDLGSCSLPNGTYLVGIFAYDPSHPLGQPLIHPSGKTLYFKVV